MGKSDVTRKPDAGTKKVKKVKKNPTTEKEVQETKEEAKPEVVETKPSSAGENLDLGEDVVIERDQVKQALEAMKNFMDKRKQDESLLFDDDNEQVGIQISISKIPEKRTYKPFRITMPHTIWADTADVCLMVKDPQRKWKDLLEECNVPQIKKVIDVKKFKQRYAHQHERRELVKQFDLFLCDKKIDGMLPGLCGTHFHRKTKGPFPVRMFAAADRLEESLKKALQSSFFKYSCGPCVGIKFGRPHMTVEQLMENLEATLKQFIPTLPEGTAITTVSISGNSTPSLQIYANQVTKVEDVVAAKGDDEKAIQKETRQRIHEAKQQTVKELRESGVLKNRQQWKNVARPKQGELKLLKKHEHWEQKKARMEAAEQKPEETKKADAESDDEKVKALKPAKVTVVHKTRDGESAKKDKKDKKEKKAAKAVKKEKKSKA